MSSCRKGVGRAFLAFALVAGAGAALAQAALHLAPFVGRDHARNQGIVLLAPMAIRAYRSWRRLP